MKAKRFHYGENGAFGWDFEINDMSEEIKTGTKEQILRALTHIGLKMTTFARDLCPVDTGALKKSITYQVDADENSVTVGSNSEYATYVELGTGEYSEVGGKALDISRPTYWGNSHRSTAKTQAFHKARCGRLWRLMERNYARLSFGKRIISTAPKRPQSRMHKGFFSLQKNEPQEPKKYFKISLQQELWADFFMPLPARSTAPKEMKKEKN